MASFLTPLDEILNIVNDLYKSNHTNRRGSTLDNALEKITANINVAKNNIIPHLLDNKHAPLKEEKESITYSQAVKSSTNLAKNLIIPIAEGKPNNSCIAETEMRVQSILHKTNSKATIVKTSTTDKGNYIVKFSNDDIVDTIKEDFCDKIKVTKPFFPKIKIVSVPSFFKTTNKNDVISSLVEGNKFLQEIYSKNHDCLKFLFSYDVHGHQSIILKCSRKFVKLSEIMGML